ncbi:hypothetical protein MBLNU230_g2412t1 [Neophaeotheca triangularis]
MSSLLAAVTLFAVTGSFALPVHQNGSHPCNTIDHGYQCEPEISHLWGQYSPYFSVPSEISPAIPPQCKVTFAQVLARHGARYPTSKKTALYNATIAKIHSQAESYAPEVAFLEDYEYGLGADDLTDLGREQMLYLGVNFYERYADLINGSENHTPFIRASDSQRVVESAGLFAQGFHHAATKGGHHNAIPPSRSTFPSQLPYPILTIPENNQTNNTLDHGTCTIFETQAPYNTMADAAQETFLQTFIAPIQTRLNTALPDTNLTSTETIYLLDLCAFETVASCPSQPSPFCPLFSMPEFHSYNYYRTLGKHFHYGTGNPLGPTQGLGFARELLARLTTQPITSIGRDGAVNTTLDTAPSTFPLDRALYADFSHDSTMASILAALGLYRPVPATAGKGEAEAEEQRPPVLPDSTIVPAEQAEGYSNAWTVPFGARVYFEKLLCDDFGRRIDNDASEPEEAVRVVVNDRVLPLGFCGGDWLGRCGLGAFGEGMGFVREGGGWEGCFS